MRSVIFLLALVAISSRVSSQSLFKPLPKKSSTESRSRSMIFQFPADSAVVAPGTTYQGFRFDGPSVLIAFPDATVYTGVGISYEHDTYRDATSKWYADWSVALKGYAGGQYAPANISGVVAAGLSVAFFNKLLTVGVLYNFTTQKVQGAAGPTTALNN